MKILLFIFGIAFAVQLATADDVSFTETIEDWFDLRFLDGQVAILLTRDGKVFRTEDLGSSWEQLNDKMFLSDDAENLPAYLYPSTTDSNKIYIRGRGQLCWISNDKGETWRTVYPGKTLVNLDWHPVNSEWALATDQNGAVYATRDFGMTWQLITSFAVNYAWGDAGIGSVPETRIYLVVQSSDFVDFQFTDDWGLAYVTLQTRAFDFAWGDHQIFVAVSLPSTGAVTLKVSTDIGKPLKNFYEATFPFGTDLNAYGYSIMDDSTGAVYLGVVHSLTTSNWGNLYVSDSTGSKYSITLPNVHQLSGFFDFTRVRGIEGFYLANIVTDNTDMDSPIVSLFTFDNGATWQRIAPPHFDSLNQSISCVGSCSLHLHGWSSSFPSDDHSVYGAFLTTPKAVGLILANGNVGESLEYDETKVNTYLSRDGGLTWVELKKGPSHYRFGDHGGVIALSDSATYSNTIYYSLNEGTSPIQTANFNGASVKPFRILSERTSTELGFIMLGSTPTGTYDVIVGMNFKRAFSRECDRNDYYTWAPSNGLEDCVLGHKTVYLRRNTSRLCFNADTVEHIVSQTNCECTEDDWECDVGYERIDGGHCKLTGTPLLEPPLYCPEGFNYTKTKGYRKAAGNTCEGGVDHSPDGPYPCPEFSQNKKHPWVAAIVFVLVVVGVIIIGFILMKSERVRQHVPFLKFLHEKTAYLKLSQQPETVEDRDRLYIPTEEEEESQLDVRDKKQDKEEEEEKKKEIKKDAKKDEPKSLIPVDDDFNPRA